MMKSSAEKLKGPAVPGGAEIETVETAQNRTVRGGTSHKAAAPVNITPWQLAMGRRRNELTRIAWRYESIADPLGWTLAFANCVHFTRAGLSAETLAQSLTAARLDIEERVQAEALGSDVVRRRPFTAAEVGRLISATIDDIAAAAGERAKIDPETGEITSLPVVTIAPADESPGERSARAKKAKRARDRERQRRERAGQVVPQAKSLSRLQPWEAQGVSRATWYRRQRRSGTMKPDKRATNLSHRGETEKSLSYVYKGGDELVSSSLAVQRRLMLAAAGLPPDLPFNSHQALNFLVEKKLAEIAARIGSGVVAEHEATRERSEALAKPPEGPVAGFRPVLVKGIGS